MLSSALLSYHLYFTDLEVEPQMKKLPWPQSLAATEQGCIARGWRASAGLDGPFFGTWRPC